MKLTEELPDGTWDRSDPPQVWPRTVHARQGRDTEKHGHKAHRPGTYSGVGEIKPTRIKESEGSAKLQAKKGVQRREN